MSERDGKQGVDWPAYFDAVAGLPARETLVYALARFEGDSHAELAEGAEEGMLAVDLGCGDGRDAVEMLSRGWRVVAVDSEAEGIARLMERVPGVVRARLATLVAR